MTNRGGRRLAELKEARASLWTDERQRDGERALALRLEKLNRPRRARPWVFVGALAATACVVVVLGVRRAPHQVAVVPTAKVAPVVEPLPPARHVAFDDGSRIDLLDARSSVRPRTITSDRIVMLLLEGTIRCDISRRPQRVFRVESGPVAIEVLGTSFDVTRLGDRARVVVNRGRVRVSWPGGTRVLDAGDVATLPPPESDDESIEPAESATPADLPEPDVAPSESPARRPHAIRARRSSDAGAGGWRTLARRGDREGYVRAYEAVKQAGPSAVRDEPADLLLAADVARLSGHPAEALRPLEKIVSQWAADKRSGMAAFTLGRVLLENLAKPREAAEAFAAAGRLDTGGAFAELALGRELQAWHKAGELERARRKAAEYLERYPRGNKRDVARAILRAE